MKPNRTAGDGGSGEVRATGAPDGAQAPAVLPHDRHVLNSVLAEVKAMREQLGALTSELRARKRQARKRGRTIARRVADAVHAPTELEIARARRLLR